MSALQKRNYVPAPEGIDAYTPFGPGIHHLLFYQRYSHFLSYARLKGFCSDVLKFDLSEGAIANSFEAYKGKIYTKVEG
jgi:hypothetical protein